MVRHDSFFEFFIIIEVFSVAWLGFFTMKGLKAMNVQTNLVASVLVQSTLFIFVNAEVPLGNQDRLVLKLINGNGRVLPTEFIAGFEGYVSTHIEERVAYKEIRLAIPDLEMEFLFPNVIVDFGHIATSVEKLSKNGF
jgi:uncharacterized protein YebE (UPF0316 family)